MEEVLLVHVCECKHCLAKTISHAGPLAQEGCGVYRELLDRMKATAAISESIAQSQGHLSEEAIEEYHFRRLNPACRASIDSHLSNCVACSKLVQQHGEFVACLKRAFRGWQRDGQERPAMAASGKAHSRQLFSAEDLSAARARLPVSQVAGIEALRVLQKENASMQDVEKIVKTDPVVSAHLIRVANSALLSYGQEARSIQQAIARIGFDSTRLHISALSMKRMFLSPNLQRIWNHSVLAAQISRQLASMTNGIPPDEACLAALVHDIGQIELAGLGVSFEKALAQRLASGMRLVNAERELCGADHAEVGADLLESWHFARDMAQAVRFHHAPGSSQSPLACILYVTETWLDNQEDLCDLEQHRSALRRLGLSRSDLARLTAQCAADLEMLRFAA